MESNLEILKTRDLTKFRPIDVILVELLQFPQVDFPLINKFSPGLYVRERFLPGDTIYVTAIHKTDNPFIISSGDVSVSHDGSNWTHYVAPYSGITKAGTQRIIVTHAPTVWTTIHANPDDERDISKIEDRIAAFPDLPEELTQGMDIKPLTIL